VSARAGETEPPVDLRAALQRSRMPAFTAECFHHYQDGASKWSWPSWLKSENLKDSDGRKPEDPAFNQGTLWVPKDVKVQKDEGFGTPMLLQYWKLKSAHFDKIALFKVGKFYELFFYDAFIAQRECGLKWMGEKKPHVGFPEVMKNNYAKMLVDAGYKVVVVEQVERVAETNQRKEQKKETGAAAAGPSCVEREACEVFTKGTVVEPEFLGSAASRYMTYLHFEEASAGGSMPFSACLVDCATSQIQVGRIVDEPDRNALRTLLAQLQPSEVAYSVANMPSDVLALIKRMPCRPQLSPVQADVGLMAARDRVGRYRQAHPKKIPEAVEATLAEDGAIIAASGVMAYLEEVLLGSRVLPFAIWDVLDAGVRPSVPGACGPSKRLVLDATALSALEVLETLEGTYKNSLLDFLDHTTTPFGFRRLKQWLCAPLYDREEIQQRNEVVEFLMQHRDIAQHLSSGLKKVCGGSDGIDLERATSRVWGFALQTERHAVMYEDITAKRLGDFMNLLKAYEQCLHLVGNALPVHQQGLPTRLVQLTRSHAHGGSFPELQNVISRLCGSVVETTNPKNGKVKSYPSDGVYQPHDTLKRQIAETMAKLDRELQGLKAKFPKAQCVFVHRLPGFRYEVETEEGMLPSQFLASVDVTYRNKNKLRFHTETIKGLIAELESLEDQREDCLFPFLARLFQEFHAHQAQFRAAVRCLAELDALLSLAAASSGLTGGSCRAEIVALDDPDAPGTLEVRACRHPVAASKMGTTFVPNDTLLNAGGVPGVLVVTGPNMGGKSTVLRQTCIAVIMAQLGCRVNAASCRLSPVDRIFTRIGSYDTILEGKSTLLIELEETAAVLAHGSRRSLVVLDELGRGTSTFDGAAIASAVLDDITKRVQCMLLFATHYHPVSKEASQSPQVAPFHMAAEVDRVTNEMTFLYRFLPGLCPASHGHHVARLAGLPGKVLEEALAEVCGIRAGQGRRERESAC